MAFIAWPQALKSDEKHSFFLAPHGAPRCHGTLSILSITHGNHMKGEGLLTLIRILFSKCVFFLTLGYFRNVFVGKTHLSTVPVVVHVLSRIQKSCKEYLRLWTLSFGIVTKSKTSWRPRGLPWRRRLMRVRW